MKPYERRKILIERMDELEGLGFSCRGCAGTCCTYEANSMMVTPIEALELVTYLKKNNSFDESLKNKCIETIAKFRLDQQLGNGKKSFLRRTYTCPFFNHQELGCPLPREVKPYGCLAFNSHHPELKAGAECFSEKEILEAREKAIIDEEKENQEIKKKYSLYWDKTPLPLALMDFFNEK
jgi:Fe-S-cluster containining protein